MIAIDLFAGAGGFTEGATMAGVKVVWAANHWKAAVDVHALNHPETVHSCQDLHQADFSLVPAHDLLLGSPSCVGHTRARGKEASHHDAARSTAWAVVSCAEVHRPRVIVIENVPEMTSWELYPAWQMAMRALGYHMGEHLGRRRRWRTSAPEAPVSRRRTRPDVNSVGRATDRPPAGFVVHPIRCRGMVTDRERRPRREHLAPDRGGTAPVR